MKPNLASFLKNHHRQITAVRSISLQVLLVSIATWFALILPNSAKLPSGSMILLWPACGIGFALIWKLGLSSGVIRCVCGIALGMCAAFASGITASWPVIVGLVIAQIGHFLGLAVSIYLLPSAMRIINRAPATDSFSLPKISPHHRIQWLIALYSVSILAGAPVSAMVGTLASLLIHTPTHTPELQLAWGVIFVQLMALYTVSVLIFGPLSMTFLKPSVKDYRTSPYAVVGNFFKHLGDPTSLLLSMLLCSAIGFYAVTENLFLARSLSLLLLPLIAWTAMRCSARSTYSTIAFSCFMLLAARRNVFYATDQGYDALEAVLLVLIGTMLAQLLQAVASDRRVAFAQLERQARRDNVTHLLNELGFTESLESLLTDPNWIAQRPGVGLLSISFPDLSRVSLLAGPQRSPILLEEIVNRLESQPTILLARLEPDHFLALIDSHDIDAVTLNAHDMAQVLTGIRIPVPLGTCPVPALISGLFACLPSDLSARQLIDAIRYDPQAAVLRGAATHTTVTHTLSVDYWREQSLRLERVKEAIMARRINLFAQLIVSNRTPQTQLRVEVFARLLDSQGQMMTPAEFLPSAQSGGLTASMDRAVITAVFEWFTDHPWALRRIQRLGINISGASLKDEGFVPFVKDLLNSLNLPANKFGFEITEAEAILNRDAAARIIGELRQLGFSIAIDDFGTGLATFDYLKRFQIDELKINGSFISTLGTDLLDQEIVLSVVRVAQRLGIRTIAKFVSTDALKVQVSQIGIDYSQGFAVGKPMPIDALITPF